MDTTANGGRGRQSKAAQARVDATVVEHDFPEQATAVGKAGPEGEAALRQLTVQRLMGYGVEYGDAIRVRAAVAKGVQWRPACLAVAESALDDAATGGVPRSARSRRDRSYRASALLRMAQMMMLRDDDERRALYARAAALFAQSCGQCCDGEPSWRRLTIPARGRHLVAWHRPADADAQERVGRAVLVIGGIEGWAMDLEAFGGALAARGLATLLLDGPGQGESRFEHRAYLSHAWKDDLSAVLDHLEGAVGVRSIGVLGNSMGGTFALHLAASDRRVAACCNNGGLMVPLSQRERTGFFPKMEAFCDPASEDDCIRVWDGLEVRPEHLDFEAPLLIVQGGADPLVSIEDSSRMLEWATAADKRMHVFAQSDHCIYDRPSDKYDLVADWFASRL